MKGGKTRRVEEWPDLRLPIEPVSEDRLLNTRELGSFLGVKTATLKWWRVRAWRRGPRFIRVGGRVRYSLADVKAYLLCRTVRTESGKTSRERK
jgi:predicted DNA-binding transcriptional regulator AlpA